ncbi:hypothetical protein AArcSl_3082 [Halalkaliarchaeum desulfuricum]|uniref:HTH marR-type domain-containing protein n=1 Tax=Halalkaliarchaeum desulfuricum TaxID=2055893 RepID=A0A343TNL7_9EURY|nr:MarR family transcriptional regulator [Halalkaliarchaeum desulfuricum]AUX10689.1 hypothetical protein AArcSl_3082 [Halalkaliarchaeum desulfuricum]
MSDKTELQRKILITAYNNPTATQAEIAKKCNCSSSYVSTVLNRYDRWDAMDAQIEQLNQDLGYAPDHSLGPQPSTQPAWSNDEFQDVEGVDAEEIAAFIDETIEAFQTLSGQKTAMSTGEMVVALGRFALVLLVVLFAVYLLVPLLF